MLANSLLFLASATLALASPYGGCAPPVKPTLPISGAKELPAPPANLVLKHIALGLGIQNYTCATVGGQATANGAVAMLYDITHLYPSRRRGSLDQTAWEKLSSRALNSHEIPLNRDPSTTGRIPGAIPGADAKNPFPQDGPLKLDGLQPMSFAGHHFFSAAGVPQFVLGDGKEVFAGKKLVGIDAPTTNEDKGPDGTGAVQWLQLGDAGGSIGLSMVYRVFTAGGNPHSCTAIGTDSTAYTATYWFYG